jgi:PAS domain S-box-containing protein
VRTTRRHWRRSRSQLAVAESVGHIASWDLDVASGSLIWSSEVYRLLGLDPEPVTPTFDLFTSLVHPDDLDRWLERHAVGTASRQPYSSEFRIVRPDGTVRALRASIGLDTDDVGTIIRQFGILQDVTEAVATTVRAERLAGQLQMVQRLTHSGSWELDLASGASLWSDGMYAILGLSRDDPLPAFDEFVDRQVHPDDRAALHAVVDAHVRSGTAFSTAIRIRRPGGTRSGVDLYAEFDRDADGTPVTMRGTLHATPSPTGR